MASRGLFATIFSTLLLLSGGYTAPQRHQRSNYDDIKNKVAALEAMSPKLIQSQPGKAVRLPCVKTNKGNVTWLYKHCGRGLMTASCELSSRESNSNSSDGSWKPLPCQDPRGCSEVFVLDSAREEQSGLYRCMYTYSNQSAYSHHRTVVATYMVQIIVPAAPSLLLVDGLPSNETVSEGQTAVMRCRVRSHLRPTIRWLRLETNPPTDARGNTLALKYLNVSILHMSQLMKSKDIPESEDTFLSKLVLPMATQADSGFYICLAINEVSNATRGAYLHVEPSKDMSPLLPPPQSHPPLPLLFLIPAGLALMPSLLWGFYVYRRRVHHKVTSFQSTTIHVTLHTPQCKCNYCPAPTSTL